MREQQNIKLPLSHHVLVFFLVIIALSACSVHGLRDDSTEIVDNSARFVIQAPQAKEVDVIGSFNHWDPHSDRLEGPGKNGVWTITIPLSEGRYEYLFLIDGKTGLLDPATPSVEDGLGGRNSVIYRGP